MDDPPRGAVAHHFKARGQFWHGMWELMPPVDQCADPCGGLSLPLVCFDDHTSLPMPPLERCREMRRRYRARTSVGLAWISPRHHVWLSDEFLL
eukprot:1881518-Pyramimonas_sp.AAC.1